MKKLYLHVGFPKTGSSYLQELFWANAAFLKQQWGIHFHLPPVAASTLARRPGNSVSLVQDIAAGKPLAPLLAPYLDTDAPASLISTEFWSQLSHAQNEAVLAHATSHGYRVHAIGFRRNPFDMAIAAYLQNVKRNPGVGTFLEHCQGFSDKAHDSADRIGAVLPLDVLDYDAAKTNLAQAFFSALGHDAAALPNPVQAQVNRSLSREEAHWILKMRARDDEMANYLAITLAESYPFSGTRLAHTRETFDALCRALKLDPATAAAQQNFVPQDAALDNDALLETAERIQVLLRDRVRSAQAKYTAGADALEDIDDLPEQFQERRRMKYVRHHAENLRELPRAERKAEVAALCAIMQTVLEFRRLAAFFIKAGMAEEAAQVIALAVAAGHDRASLPPAPGGRGGLGAVWSLFRRGLGQQQG
ncbi:MAG: hypothetical protein EP335_08275 [Alphaproteobacteria bacterium]|nr:MAG: hypothetical protein EP335_08275 [Alphaproteobacteria bacterium]